MSAPVELSGLYTYNWSGDGMMMQPAEGEFVTLHAVHALLAAAPACADPVVETNVSLLRSRSALGVEKYGVTLDNSKAPLRDWLEHALLESLDFSNYIQKAMQVIDAAPAHPCPNPAACDAQGCRNPLGRCEDAAPATPAAKDEEILALHRNLAGETLRADQGWQRYEEANRDRNALRAASVQPNSGRDAAPVQGDVMQFQAKDGRPAFPNTVYSYNGIHLWTDLRMNMYADDCVKLASARAVSGRDTALAECAAICDVEAKQCADDRDHYGLEVAKRCAEEIRALAAHPAPSSNAALETIKDMVELWDSYKVGNDAYHEKMSCIEQRMRDIAAQADEVEEAEDWTIPNAKVRVLAAAVESAIESGGHYVFMPRLLDWLAGEDTFPHVIVCNDADIAAQSANGAQAAQEPEALAALERLQRGVQIGDGCFAESETRVVKSYEGGFSGFPFEKITVGDLRALAKLNIASQTKGGV